MLPRMCCHFVADIPCGYSQLVTLEDCTIWELIVFLDQCGFKHIVQKAAKNKEVACDPKDPETWRWFSRPGQESPSGLYLFGLAQGKQVVEHWHCNEFYRHLLAGEKYDPTTRQRRRNINFDPSKPEGDWDAGADEVAPPPKKKVVAPKKKKI